MASMNQIREGLEILCKYADDPDDCNSFDAQHDIVYSGPDVLDLASPEDAENPVDTRISKEDHARLLALRWFIDRESGSWAHFT